MKTLNCINQSMLFMCVAQQASGSFSYCVFMCCQKIHVNDLESQRTFW